MAGLRAPAHRGSNSAALARPIFRIALSPNWKGAVLTVFYGRPGSPTCAQSQSGRESRILLNLSEGQVANKFLSSSVSWTRHTNGKTQSCPLLFHPLTAALVFLHPRSSVEFSSSA